MGLQTILSSGLSDILALVGSLLATMLVVFIKSHFSASQITTAKSIATTAVKFAEEEGLVKSIKGYAKFSTALNKVKDLAASRGLKLTDEQWEGFIKEAVNDARLVWNQVGFQNNVLSEPQPIISDAPTTNIVTNNQTPAEDTKPDAPPETPTVPDTAPLDPFVTVQQAVQQVANKALEDVGKQFSDAITKGLTVPNSNA